jgi:hypothetical protein
MKILMFLMAFISLSFIVYAQNNASIYQTENFKIVLNNKGLIEGIYNKKDDTNYLAPNQIAPLVSIRCNGAVEIPLSMKSKGPLLIFSFGINKVEAKMKVITRQSYLTFELIEITPANKVELILWGPYPTIIKETIGETVGVVRNNRFAIGIQALNIKTLGGYPNEENDIEPSYNILEGNNRKDVEDSLKASKLFRGQTAKSKDYGSELQAYCRNRNKERIISNWGHDYYIAPAFDDGGVVGSKIALFGCQPEKSLEIIGQIETQEGLPHPVIDGEWSKTSPNATASYLITDFSDTDIDEALELTKKAGLKYLYHGGPFETWGHFKLNEKSFPDNWNSMKRCVDMAEKQGIHLGVHTLSNFISINDTYVSPKPDQRLAQVGSSELTTNIDILSNEIPVRAPQFFNQMKNNNLHAVLIGDEIIRYKEVSTSKPWLLLACIRGAFGTTPYAHKKGDTIIKLMDHSYKTFLTNSQLSVEVAGQIASLFNYTGLHQISFDGFEGNWSTGMGQYGCQLFLKTWYDRLKPELKGKIINDASMPGHFNWHINTRYNWGEPWYAGFRESQTQYRLKNQDYFNRNFIPSMLGWFNLAAETSIEDIEWLLARAAGFDAGFALCVDTKSTTKNGQSDAIFEAIKQWESARLKGAFSIAQKLKLKDVYNEFHLETVNPGEWNLYPFQVKHFVHEQKVHQPGEPAFSIFDFENPYHSQPLIFTLRLLPGANSNSSLVKKIIMEVNNYSKIEIPVDLEPFQTLKSFGSSKLQVFDKNWKLLKVIDLTENIPFLSQGDNKIVFDAVFADQGSSSFKIEIKTLGEAETVKTDHKVK